ncbi:hypothetical protein AVEN_8047-1 [Araneus ventricosus]|uniref:Uncharacterized protein n=1 Tax=Araneus ventricosus TaxID=182803 RepID=A0A4Y2U582_ARAVE|nr:hypothetical protein AVEN_8047-1 [Araneus ventricosus]
MKKVSSNEGFTEYPLPKRGLPPIMAENGVHGFEITSLDFPQFNEYKNVKKATSISSGKVEREQRAVPSRQSRSWNWKFSGERCIRS